jgi:hypothetical protein
MILPSPDEVRVARLELGFTPEQAARLVHSTETAWGKWEAHYASDDYDLISGAHWELFLRKTDKPRSKESRFKLRKGI